MNSAHLEETIELIVDHITDGINSNFGVAQQLANSRTSNPFVHACATVLNANASLGQLDKLQVSAAAISDIFGLVYPVMRADGKIDASELEVLRDLMQDSLHRYTWIGEYRRFRDVGQATALALLLAEWSTDSSPLGGNVDGGSLFTPCLALAVLAREITQDEDPLLTYCQGLHLVIHMVAEALGWHEQEQIVVKRLEAILAEARGTAFTADDESAEQDPTLDSNTEALREAVQELSCLVGLNDVKSEVTRLIRSMGDRSSSLPESDVPLNFQFLGNPGIGKSKVTKILAKVLYGLGRLTTSKVVTWDMSQTVEANLSEACDGMLCFELSEGEELPINLLRDTLALQANAQGQLSIILSGAAAWVERVFEVAPELKEQFSRRLCFQDLHVAELFQVFERLCDSNGYLLTSVVRGNLAILLNRAYTNRGEHFTNVHFVRQIFDATVEAHAERLSESQSKVTKILLASFDETDLPFDLIARGTSPYNLTASRWKSACPTCNKETESPVKQLGRNVSCECGETYKFPSWNLRPDTVPELIGFQVYEGPQDLIGLSPD